MHSRPASDRSLLLPQGHSHHNTLQHLLLDTESHTKVSEESSSSVLPPALLSLLSFPTCPNSPVPRPQPPVWSKLHMPAHSPQPPTCSRPSPHASLSTRAPAHDATHISSCVTQEVMCDATVLELPACNATTHYRTTHHHGACHSS